MNESDGNYPKDALHMYAKNESAMKRNEDALNDLPSEFHTIEANDKIQDNSKCLAALFQVAQNLKQI